MLRGSAPVMPGSLAIPSLHTLHHKCEARHVERALHAFPLALRVTDNSSSVMPFLCACHPPLPTPRGKVPNVRLCQPCPSGLARDVIRASPCSPSIPSLPHPARGTRPLAEDATFSNRLPACALRAHVLAPSHMCGACFVQCNAVHMRQKAHTPVLCAHTRRHNCLATRSRT